MKNTHYIVLGGFVGGFFIGRSHKLATLHDFSVGLIVGRVAWHLVDTAQKVLK